MNHASLKALQQAIREGRIEWRKHLLQRLAERGIAQSAVMRVLLHGEMIRDYPADKPFPSSLFFGIVSGKPMHVVAACDEKNKMAYIITAYEPSLEIFENDYRTRKKK